jgi:hypothetical protein
VFQVQESLRQFRLEVYQVFCRSRDAAFELIDAIASSPNARSAVEVSESPLMKRSFASVYKGLERTRIDECELNKVLVRQAETHGELTVSGYAIYSLDHTPYPRQNAPTVSDRGFVRGADGCVIGHQYSLLGRVMHSAGAWVGVVDCDRIPTDKTPVQVGAEQVTQLRQLAILPSIITADCEYLTREMLDQAHERTPLLMRMKHNRVLYHAPKPCRGGRRQPGRPKLHGRRFKLNEARSLGKPDESFVVHTHNDNGECDGRIEIAVFKNVHVRSHPHLHGCVVRVQAFHADGKRKFARPIWLYWTGPHDMDWITFWRVYLKRFCIESVHQFTKNSLAWTSARLGYTEREERWSWLVMLAYWQLLMSAPSAQDARRPWQKPMPAGRLPTPARVQRDYWRIFMAVGTPASPPKQRGIPLGRPKGFRPTPRPCYRVVVKGAHAT